MDKKDILRMANDPRFIPGIYNYCDRWCERCTFTSRCLTYAMEKEETEGMEQLDLNNKAFWDRGQSIFQHTIEMLNEMATERGIDLNSLDTESASAEFSIRKDELRNHEISLYARQYSKIVDNWFELEHPLFEQKEDELHTMLRLDIRCDRSCAESAEISDSVEVIRWYQHLIYVKLMRALSNEESINFQEEDNTYQSDSDGSALVALIAIDRSIGAWGQLQEHFPDRTNNILDILLHLDKLRRRIEQVFPDARNFKRPGFEDSN